MRILLVAVVVLSPAIAAAQGWCLTKEKRTAEAQRLEDDAKAPGANELSGGTLWCVTADQKDPEISRAEHEAFRKRANAACLTIAAREPKTRGEIVDACTDFLVENGTTKAGSKDLVARIFARSTKWTDEPTLHAMATTRDGRARTAVLDAVKLAFKDTAGKDFSNLSTNYSWIQFRMDALAALELVGTKADLEVVDDLAATIGNRETVTGVKERDLIGPAAAKARAAMSRR